MPTALITGCTGTIGRCVVRQIAEHGYAVVGVNRDAESGRRVLQQIAEDTGTDALTHRACDLSSMAAVRDLADEVRSAHDRLDLFVHGATTFRTERVETEDGFEQTFAVDFLAPYLLTAELEDLLVDSAPARVVAVTSEAHRSGDLHFDDLHLERDYSLFEAMGQSKLALTAWAIELAERLDAHDVSAHAVHPGLVPSGRERRHMPWWMRAVMATLDALPVPFKSTPDEAAARIVHAATEAEGTGAYFQAGERTEAAPAVYDADVRHRLWDAAAELTGAEWTYAAQ